MAIGFDQEATELDIMRGEIDGQYIISKYGINSDVDGPEDIANQGGDYSGFPTSAPEEFEVFSSDAADTVGGTGARVLRLFYYDDDYRFLDANDNFLYVDVDLNGITGVLTGRTGMRIWRAKVIDSGSGQTNAGTITVRWATTTSVVFLEIEAGSGQSESTAFTIPKDFTGYLKRYAGTMDDANANTALMSLKVREFGTNTFRLIRPFKIGTDIDFNRLLFGGEQFAEQTDMVFRCRSIDNANGVITIDYALLLVRNS